LDAIALLLDDYKRLRELSEKLADTTERAVETRKNLLKSLEIEFRAHTTIDEELFYPAFLDATNDIKDAHRVAEGIEEHHACDQKVIPDLNQAAWGSIALSGEAKVLNDYIFHHRADRPHRPECAGRTHGGVTPGIDRGHGITVQPC
jgi:hypothetical protein